MLLAGSLADFLFRDRTVPENTHQEIRRAAPAHSPIFASGQNGKVTAKDVGAGVTFLAVTPWAAGLERNTVFHRLTFTHSLEPFGIER